MKRLWLIVLGCFTVAVSCHLARAADHAAGTRVSRDPSADITDVFAWMSPDTQRINLVMDLVRNATTASKFSDSVQYVFHTTSRSNFGASPGPEVTIICTFNQAQTIQCWAGNDEYVTGDASNTNGIVSDDEKFRVFAGLRNDPF